MLPVFLPGDPDAPGGQVDVEHVGGDEGDQAFDCLLAFAFAHLQHVVRAGRDQPRDRAERLARLVLDRQADEVAPVVLALGGLGQGLAWRADVEAVDGR